VTSLATAGVLGETYIDISSTFAKGPQAVDGDTLPPAIIPIFRTWSAPAQSTLQNMDALLKRLDRIVAFVESGRAQLAS